MGSHPQSRCHMIPIQSRRKLGDLKIGFALLGLTQAESRLKWRCGEYRSLVGPRVIRQFKGKMRCRGLAAGTEKKCEPPCFQKHVFLISCRRRVNLRLVTASLILSCLRFLACFDQGGRRGTAMARGKGLRWKLEMRPTYQARMWFSRGN